MSSPHTGPGPVPRLRYLACEYHSLAEDPERICEDVHPGGKDLREASTSLSRRVYIAAIPHLEGIVVGPPEVDDGAMCRVCEPITFAPFASDAQTRPWFYRLGGRDA